MMEASYKGCGMSLTMKKMCIWIVVLLSMLLLFKFAAAGTIVMKDGRQIEAEQVWLEGEMVRYKKFGTIVGLPKDQVAQVIETNALKSPGITDFGFDFWKMGMGINEVMDIAERNQVPLHREGLISVNKHFNPQMCRPYTDTHSRFDYRQQLLGYPTKVTLVFTPRSRRLALIKVHLAANAMSPSPSPKDSILNAMTGKYGEPKKMAKKLFQKDAAYWQLSRDNVINLSSGSNWSELTYINALWQSALENEEFNLKEIERKANLKKDAQKF